MNIIIDAMGGDNAPSEIVKGTALATRKYRSDLVLVGDKPKIEAILKNESCDRAKIEIVHTEEEITMEDDPLTVVRAKKNSSMGTGLRLLKESGDAFISAGNTGALHVGSSLITRSQEEMVHPTDAMWYNEQVELGFNYRITDFQAALLSSQLNKLAKFSARRQEIVERYNEAFCQMPELIVQKEIPESDTTRHLYILRLNLERLTCDRRQFFDALRAENVIPQVHYMPVYYHSYYEKLGYTKGICPNAEKLYDEIMSIPLYFSLTDKEVEDTICAVKKVVAYYKL